MSDRRFVDALRELGQWKRAHRTGRMPTLLLDAVFDALDAIEGGGDVVLGLGAVDLYLTMAAGFGGGRYRA